MQSINDFSKNRFVSFFGNIFENSAWIAEKTYLLAPFKNYNDLKYKMLNIFESSGKKNQLQILLNHPDLADKVKISYLTNESKNEQINSKLDQCTEEEFKEFKNLNIKYKKNFGFPFILSASGKNKNQILKCFKERIMLDSEIEFNEALKQVKIIATTRLDNMEKFLYRE